MKKYDFEAKKINGEKIKLNEYQGKILLIVNTASKCGLTPQYKELEELYRKYKDQGLIILGFPCNQFGNQEPGNNEQIKEFCEINFGVSFPIFEKIDVNGKNAHPLFQYLKKEKGSWLGSKIKWNFTKFLVDRNGKVVQRFAPSKSPLKIESAISKFL